MESGLVGQGIAIESEDSLFKPYKPLCQVYGPNLVRKLLVTLTTNTDKTD